MRQSHVCAALLMALSWLAWSAFAASPLPPHQHGYADLEVLIDGAQIDVTLDTPLYNLLAFEHPPRTAAEQDKARQMVQLLRQPARLLVFSPAAGCQVRDLQLYSPALPAALLQDGPAPAKAETATPSVPPHSNLTGHFHFRCQHPEALGQLRVELFNPFLYLTVVKVQIRSDKGEKAALLTSDKNSIPF
ncbi:ZrgA family zinc uptake protein [Leeia oryzae]|uniref:ZrgA family zinc uptake protein n=1 Tax=Leeia oryzae TaxID=356662 RepID=UPI000367B5E7|nr:DUF2796 domain-containing protein [Leeia oryzae]